MTLVLTTKARGIYGDDPKTRYQVAVCVETDELCIKNDETGIKNDEFWIQMIDLHFKMMNLTQTSQEAREEEERMYVVVSVTATSTPPYRFVTSAPPVEADGGLKIGIKILRRKMKILPLKNDDFGATRGVCWH